MNLHLPQRRPSLLARSLKLFLFGAALPLFGAASLEAKPPNILFCVADDASYDGFSADGCTWLKTPAFDRVAREGLRFTRAYTPNAKCAPSRAVLLTGRNSWQLGAAANHGAFYPDGYRTYVEALARHGYAVGYTGKGWGPGDPGTVDGKPRPLAGPVYNQVKCTPPTDKMSRIDYAANFAEFLKAKPKDQPFCFWYGCHDPHRPYAYGSGSKLGGHSPSDIPRIPPYWPDTPEVREDLLDYGFAVEHFDKQLGEILDLLDKTGEIEDTIVVVTSDNGMPFPRVKGTAYDEATHMPLAIRWPHGIKSPGRAVDDYVSFIDIAPTFLAAAGVDPAEAGMEPIQGRGLQPIFQRDQGQAAGPEAGRDSLIIGQERHDLGRPNDVGYPIRGLFYDGFLYLKNFEPTRWPMCDPITGYLNTDGGPTKSVILDRNRHGIDHEIWQLDFGFRPAEELYDLKADPDCMVNLADDAAHAARRDALRERLLAELHQQHDPRVEGNGAVFDAYPYDSPNRGFYERYVNGHEKLKANWVEESDFENPDFDPQHPTASAAPAHETIPANP
jgi:N-sulfoglucosamine sulfohydrolase